MAFGRSFALSKGRRGIFDARDNVSACYTHKGKTDTTNDSSAGVDTAVLKKKRESPSPCLNPESHPRHWPVCNPVRVLQLHLSGCNRPRTPFVVPDWHTRHVSGHCKF